MRFGTYHTFQCPPWTTPERVLAEELERVALAEALGFDSVWVPEQHFFDYCACPDALEMVTHLLGRTTRVRVGAAVVNLSLAHPLRVAERVALLDHLYGDRFDVCVGRGYQWPQNVVFGVDEADSKPRFDEALDVLLAAWSGERFSYPGTYYDVPEVRIWPAPRRPPAEILLHAVGATTSLERTIERGLPLALAQPFNPLTVTADALARYTGLLDAGGLAEGPLAARSVVVLYSLLAPSAAEARELARRPFEWHLSRLGRLMTPTADWASLYEDAGPSRLDDGDYAERCETMLVFDDPEGCAAKLELLGAAGLHHVVLWMGVGGVAHEHVVRSMRLFAEEVLPRFAG